VTTREAAELPGLTQARIRQLCAEGPIPCRKLGGDSFLKESDVKRFAKLPPGVRWPPAPASLGRGQGARGRERIAILASH
jgi:excisionase family DNA binding protein